MRGEGVAAIGIGAQERFGPGALVVDKDALGLEVAPDRDRQGDELDAAYHDQGHNEESGHGEALRPAPEGRVFPSCETGAEEEDDLAGGDGPPLHAAEGET